MKKSQIQFHSDRGPALPAVNVKSYRFPRIGDVQAHFPDCSDEQASRALGFAFEQAAESFWEGAQELAEHYLGSGVKVYSQGRSAGWLVVEGLPEVENWDAIRVSAWGRFCASVAKDIQYRSSAETVLESIESNCWHRDGAELYNFIDRRDGSTACIADLKKDATAAGFAPVIRH